MQNEIKALGLDFFEKLNINIDSLEVINSEEKNIFNMKIKTEDSGMLI
jgi:acetolactate synthase small subunit